MFRHGVSSDKFSKHTHKKRANGLLSQNYQYKHKKQAYLVPKHIQDLENKTKVVKGYEPSHRAWMTFIQIKKGRSKFKCGGSIINNYWILSAGHCFCEQLKCKPTKKGKLRIDYKPQDHIRIITGLKDIDLYQSDQGRSQISEPVKILIHPL